MIGYSEELSIAVESRDANLVFGKIAYEQLRPFGLFCLNADDPCHRPDFAFESPWKRLRVNDDVRVGWRFVVGDTDRLSGLC
jgi:hypothetical protein